MEHSLSAERRRLRAAPRETLDHAWQEVLRLEGLWAKDPSCPATSSALQRARERYDALRSELDAHLRASSAGDSSGSDPR